MLAWHSQHVQERNVAATHVVTVAVATDYRLDSKSQIKRTRALCPRHAVKQEIDTSEHQGLYFRLHHTCRLAPKGIAKRARYLLATDHTEIRKIATRDLEFSF